NLVSEYEMPAAGGLYLARTGGFTAAIIAPPFIHGLGDLQCVSHVDRGERSVDCVLQALELARLWGHARLPGDVFSRMRQHTVLLALAQHIFRMIGGENWAEAEFAVQRSRDGISDLKRAVSKRREDNGVVSALALDCATLATAERPQCVER